MKFNHFIAENYPSILDGSLPEEGYKLIVDNDHIVICGKDMAGSYYGTLRFIDLIKNQTALPFLTEEDYPDNKLRSWYFITPTRIPEVGAERFQSNELLEERIRKGAKLRFNALVLPNAYDYNRLTSSEIQDFYQDIFSYARKYFIEPIPASFNYGKANNALSPDHLARSYFEDKEFQFDVGQEQVHFTNYLLKDYRDDQDSPDNPIDVIPFEVKVEEGGDLVLCQENIDYNVSFDAQYQYFLSRIDGGRIPSIDNQANVFLTFNGIEPNSMKMSQRLTSLLAMSFTTNGFDQVIEYLNPKYIFIGHDEIFYLGSDYRDLYYPDGRSKNLSPSDILSSHLNYLNQYIESKNSQAELIFWGDMIDPYHRYSYNYNKTPEPHAFDAISEINNDILVDSWNYGGGSSSCEVINKSISKLSDNNLKIVASPSYSTPLNGWLCWGDLAKNYSDNIVGLIAPEFKPDREDFVMAPLLAAVMWNSQGVKDGILTSPAEFMFYDEGDDPILNNPTSPRRVNDQNWTTLIRTGASLIPLILIIILIPTIIYLIVVYRRKPSLDTESFIKENPEINE